MVLMMLGVERIPKPQKPNHKITLDDCLREMLSIIAGNSLGRNWDTENILGKISQCLPCSCSSVLTSLLCFVKAKNTVLHEQSDPTQSF